MTTSATSASTFRTKETENNFQTKPISHEHQEHPEKLEDLKRGSISIITGVTIFLHDKTKIAEAVTALLAGIGLLYAADIDQNPPTA
jgi:hypothetical protein